ncbi:ATP-dependent zinc protease family protein [Pimelobacter simplex]|uniref:ATP-dependent zinc protease family protein n=1 Tax=Nocardioides simplex TaxID=2045 RepID=UPI00214F7F29|nr:RimK/LysX family protein [Pimelobacter simplex]UUW90742.1 RimK/LysX family protein [Pimelobacter simplex]UUW94571.1 RimK/LysX family protein [Pimelobacter simplex]
MRLPGLGVGPVKAKLDTGARTSALHAFDLEELTRDGADWVRFSVHPWQRSAEDAVLVECPVHDRRLVRSSTGHTQERIVVLTDIELLGHTITTEMTLTRRDAMGFRMLVGREALRQGFLVDARRSYVGGRPPRKVRRKNRGRDGTA